MSSVVLESRQLRASQSSPADLGEFIRQHCATLSGKHGLSVFIDTDMDSLMREYGRLAGTGAQQLPFSPRHAVGLEGRGAWLRLEHGGKIVGLLASRMLADVRSGDRFADIARRGGLYGRGLHILDDTGWIGDAGPRFGGPDSVYYSGAGWVGKDFRGKNLASFMSRILMAKFMVEFPSLTDVTGLVVAKLHETGFPYRENGWLYREGHRVLDGYFPPAGGTLQMYLTHDTRANVGARFARESAELRAGVEPAWMSLGEWRFIDSTHDM